MLPLGWLPVFASGHTVDGTKLQNSLRCSPTTPAHRLSEHCKADLIHIWHDHRTPLILCALAILISIRIFLHIFSYQVKLIALPHAYEQDEATTTGSNQPTVKAVAGPKGPRRIKGGVIKEKKPHYRQFIDHARPFKVVVFFSSVTTKTEKLAHEYLASLDKTTTKLAQETGQSFLPPELHDLSEICFEDFFISVPKTPEAARLLYLFLVPSYNIDTINDTLIQHLEETHHDFRIDKAPLYHLLGYSVFGFGDREGWRNEREGFCFQAKELDKWMSKLTDRKRAFPFGTGDMKSDHAERFAEWAAGVTDVMRHIAQTGSLGEGAPGSRDAVESDQEDWVDGEDDENVEYDQDIQETRALEDVEDLGKILRTPKERGAVERYQAPLAVDMTTSGFSTSKRHQMQALVVKEMVAKNSPTYAALTKQGYSIVGSHSGVKICRWTKSALRGRGSCYKFSLYGINSHQCMETTPSLSCSNKCVFCWRHGTNPVGTSWRWVVDPPEMIFEGVKEHHYQKIRMMRGIPGVRVERYAEALRIRHCALSLVGEPIFYPHINEFLALLHGERISSFLVCNAQHPQQLAALKAVTQLYVSIDASNRESLRKIDRPLHRDFWERFQQCLDILREKRFRHRTVYRLTLVNGFNVEDEAEGYAQLVERGLPCFVEVKGVTYCGTATSSNAGLSMANVPFYWEVCEFVEALEKRLHARGLRYGIAAEHAHSCCILLASERFKVDGRWHTHIDYQRFFELLDERGPDGNWTPEDYMGEPTPDWALWGNGGFDPRDDRVDRKGRRIENTVTRKRPASEAG